jgi:hypothetical protein
MKEKIGIMTFYWAANYGAVLQAWALQTFLQDNGYNAEIIDYVPSNLAISLPRCFIARHVETVKLRLEEYKKEQLIKPFRAEHLNLSNKRYSSKNELKKTPPIYDCYISGSDQIWNPFFTMNGQHGVTLSYFLDFAPEGAERIAFSSSFGCSSLNKDVVKVIQPELRKFGSISVREREGVEILKSMGIRAICTADPTFLLGTDQYNVLIKNERAQEDYIYSYILHGQREKAYGCVNYVKESADLPVREDSILSVEDWLKHIHNAKYVITNSFHCVVFCIMFHVPFFSIDVKGKNMSSRITTLLDNVGLTGRFLKLPVDEAQIAGKVDDTIDWGAVDSRVEAMRAEARNYLLNAIDKTAIEK